MESKDQVARERHVTLDTRIHPTATVHESARFGAGTVVWANANVLAGVVTGPQCSIGACAEIGRDSILGSNVRISYGVFLSEEVIVGDNVFIGPRVVTTADKWPIANTSYEPNPVVIEDWASIGAGAVLLPGVTIGRGALVGAGAVVTRDVAPYTVVIGNPARQQHTLGAGEWASRVMLAEEELRACEIGFPIENLHFSCDSITCVPLAVATAGTR